MEKLFIHPSIFLERFIRTRVAGEIVYFPPKITVFLYFIIFNPLTADSDTHFP